MTLDRHLNELSLAEATELRALVQRLRDLPEQEPSPGFHARTMARLAHDGVKGGRRSRDGGHILGRKPGIGAAAAAGIAILLSVTTIIRAISQPLTQDLQWLIAQQEADGTWNPLRHGGSESFRPALTALSVLALDRSPSCPSAPIEKAIAALGRLQTEEGLFKGDDPQANAYNLAMATFALAACTAHAEEARPIVICAVEAIRASQLPNGSWDYVATPEGNVAITSWMVRALKSAEECGVESTQVAQRKGLHWLRRYTAASDGSVSYKPDVPPSDTLTALTAISFITAGRAFPDLQSCARKMTDHLSLHNKRETQRDCYRDYAKIVALQLAGRRDQAQRIRQEMESLRNTPDIWGIAGGELYTVAFTALCK
jgi:hypothetical protein